MGNSDPPSSPQLPAGSAGRGGAARVAAIDLGKARVGVAVSDELGCLAHPRPNLDGSNRRGLLSELAALARQEGVGRFLVGWPLDMTGREGIAARRAARFADELAAATGLDVELVDERWTSVQAERELRSGSDKRGARGRARVRQHVDAAAATIILQHWLDARAARLG